MLSTLIEVKTDFVGFHCWPTAPDVVGFLRNPHRHVFVVRCRFRVTHDDRQLEFFIMQDKINSVIDGFSDAQVINWSCEMWAKAIMRLTDACWVSVHEDDENGAIVSNEGV